MAIKRLLKDVWSEEAAKEAKFLIKSEGHDNIIKYHCSDQDGQYIYLALQLCNFFGVSNNTFMLNSHFLTL